MSDKFLAGQHLRHAELPITIAYDSMKSDADMIRGFIVESGNPRWRVSWLYCDTPDKWEAYDADSCDA